MKKHLPVRSYDNADASHAYWTEMASKALGSTGVHSHYPSSAALRHCHYPNGCSRVFVLLANTLLRLVTPIRHFDILEARNDINLVFTDVQTPGTMDGIKLSRYMRNRWPPVKLIAASGAAIVDQSGLPLDSRFFSKPCDDHTIIDALALLLAEETQALTV